MLAGERQVAPTLDGIRRDHTARYEWAARHLGTGCRVVDLACGIGYGTQILAKAGHEVIGLDRDREAIDYARTHYAHDRACYWRSDAEKLHIAAQYDAVVCFETIEHVKNPRPMLRELAKAAPRLLASVPNESAFPWRGHAHHYRHYTKAEFSALLAECGWRVTEWWGQAGPESEVERDCDGRTAIAVAERSTIQDACHEISAAPLFCAAAPEHVVILGLGPSLETYVDLVKRLGSRRRFADEVWGINALGDIIQCDRIFHMDDVRIQEIRAAARPRSNIAAMLEWLREHPGPIYTSRAKQDYPGMVDFPLSDVINSTGHAYFNSTAAYAVAFAVHLGVKKVSLFGCDFSYAKSHDAEKGRGCVEFWLGIASERGIDLGISDRSSLMDMCEPQERRLYGYDTVRVHIAEQAEGPARVIFTPRDKLPTADEVEALYDHSQHPNPLVGKI